MCRSRVSVALFALLLLPALPLALSAISEPVAAPQPLPEEELWYVVEMLGQRSGYLHVESGPAEHQGQAAIRSRAHLFNSVSRRNGGIQETVVISSRTQWLEDPDGNILHMEQTLDQGGGVVSTMSLEVRGDRALLTLGSGGSARQAEIPWDESIAGQTTLEDEIDRLLAGEAREATVQTFSFEAGGRVLEVKLRLLEQREDGTAVVEQEMVGLGVKTVEEYRPDGTMIRQEVGPVVMRLATREEALAPLEESLAAFERISVHLDRKLEKPRDLQRAGYRLLPREGSPADETLRLSRLFVEDHRQRIESTEDGEILWVNVEGREGTAAGGTKAEDTDPAPYLLGSSLIESDDPQIRDLVNRILQPGEEGAPPPAPPEAARRLERWVRQNVHYSGSGVGLATALQTLASKDGDCTENAFLLTALMRAAQIPARVVVGLVYAGSEPRPNLVPHAWVEAHLEGRWRAFDSAVYSSPVDATHLAMAKSAGSEEGALLEVTVPLLSGLGRFDLGWVEPSPPPARPPARQDQSRESTPKGLKETRTSL